MNVADLPLRWQSKITRTDEHTFNGTHCWHWIAAANKQGYGRATVAGKPTSTHRFAWELFVGPIPEGLHVDHLCRNRRCCNPDHLEPVTAKVNNNRRPDVALPHCFRGHEMTEENTRLYANRRYCRACQRERNRNRYVRPAA